jgi:hypothetical protein
VIAGTEMQWDRGNGFDFPQDCTDIFGRHELFDIPLVLLNISPTVVSNWVFFIQSGGKIRTSNLVYIYIYIYIYIYWYNRKFKSCVSNVPYCRCI